MNPKPMDKLDFVSSLVLTAFGIGVIVESLRLPRLDHLNVNPYTVPGIVPGLLGVLLTACGLAILIRSVLRGGWRLGLDPGTAIGWTRSAALQRVAVTLGLTLGYALILFGRVPFWLATMLFVLAFTLGTEAMARRAVPPLRSVVIALAIAAVAGVGVGYVFQNLFYVRIPG